MLGLICCWSTILELKKFAQILCTASGTNAVGVGTNVVISQTHWLVSRVRLPRWHESLYLLNEQCCHLSRRGSNSQLLCHTTVPVDSGDGRVVDVCQLSGSRPIESWTQSRFACKKLVNFCRSLNSDDSALPSCLCRALLQAAFHQNPGTALETNLFCMGRFRVGGAAPSVIRFEKQQCTTTQMWLSWKATEKYHP